MAFASGSESRRAYVAETTYGVTPATPSFKTVRATGGGMNSGKGTFVSDEVQPDRNVRDEQIVSLDPTGTLPFEFSADWFDEFLGFGLRGVWATNVLKNGILRPSFTWEETAETGATDQFIRFSGCAVNTLSMSVESRGKVSGSLGIMGRQETTANAIITGATYAAPATTAVASSSLHVSNMTGLILAPVVKSLSFELNNNLRVRDQVGSLYTSEFGAGRCDVTGSFMAYFEDVALLQQALDHNTTPAIGFTIGVEANKKYTFAFPKVRLLAPDRQLGGKSDDAMITVPFRAIFDTATACSMQVTRAVA